MLMGRKKELESDLRRKFIKFAETLGIPQDRVTFLPKTGRPRGHHVSPTSWPWRRIYSAHLALEFTARLPCSVYTAGLRPRHLLCSKTMAALHMLWMGLVLLGVLGFPETLAQGLDAVQPNFQQDKFLGRWYSAGLASNSSWFREKKTAFSMCKTVVTPSSDSGLNLTSTFLRKNQCETRIMVLQPMGVPGHYTYNSPHWGSVHSVSVVETNYDEYALLFSRGNKGPGQDFRMATLYSRTKTLKDELKEKFTSFSKAQGLTEEDIVFLPQPDKCIQE